METLTLNDILTQHGLTVEAVGTGRSIDHVVRGTYNATSEGSTVYLFIDGADSSLLEAFASLDSVVNGEALVMQANSGMTVKQLRAKIEYRNALNVDKHGEPRAKLTLGAVILGDNIADADGNAIAFSVKPHHQ